MSLSRKFTRKVRQFCKEEGLSLQNKRILLACSGGPDSVVLLYWLLDYYGEKAPWQLGLAILNHTLRPESGAEVDLVRKLAASHGLPFYMQAADIGQVSKETRQSLETAGRQIRYAFLERIKEGFAYDYIATAHHMDDQAETILAHMVRGTGLSGLAGIRPLYKDRIRPLLGVRKKEILEEAQRASFTYAIDKTNYSRAYERNRYRLDVVPLLESFNEQAVGHIAQLASRAQRLEAYLAKDVEKAYQEVTKGQDADTYNRKQWRQLPLFLQEELWRHVWQMLDKTLPQLTASHQKQLFHLVASSEPKQILWGRVAITAKYDKIKISRLSSRER